MLLGKCVYLHSCELFIRKRKNRLNDTFAQNCRSRISHLFALVVVEVLFGGEGADGADPRLLHALDPQHHPAKLLAPRHHAIQLVETRADLRLSQNKHTTVCLSCSELVGLSHEAFSFCFFFSLIN